MDYTYLERVAVGLYPYVIGELCQDYNPAAFSTKMYGDMSFGQLDTWRYETLPQLVADRFKSERCHINRKELIMLMDWKLAKGKFRPMLPKLIASNDESSVVNVTTDAFTKFFANCDSVQDGLDSYLTALKEPLDELCKLKGVGPATATLVLSLMYKVPKYAKYAPPFFSDEMYAYFLGTDEKMKYSLKEYRALITEVFPIYATFPMGIIEKGSWTLEVVRTMKIKGKSAMKLKGAFPVEVSDGMYWQSVKGKKRSVKGEEENRATKKRRL